METAKEFFNLNDKEVFYLVESGSRLWGFESKDSDYDIRGFFVYKKEKELSLSKETYFELLDKSKNLDIVLFHIDKAFNLLVKSNPSVVEWLMAKKEMVYWDKFKLQEWFNREIKQLINKKALFFHYYNLAKNNWQKYFINNKKLTYKKALYVLRGLYSALFILKYNDLPPIDFLELSKTILDKETFRVVKEIVEIKKESKEDRTFDKNELLNHIENLFAFLKGKWETLNYDKELSKLLFEKVNRKAVEIKSLIICNDS